MFLSISTVPAIYVLILAYAYFPEPGFDLLQDESAAKLLGLDLSDETRVILAGFMPREKVAIAKHLIKFNEF